MAIIVIVTLPEWVPFQGTRLDVSNSITSYFHVLPLWSPFYKWGERDWWVSWLYHCTAR